MQREAQRLHAKSPGSSLLRTDITSFYEYVNTDIVFNELRNLDLPEWAVTLLEMFLSQFNNSSNAWGLPQGPDSSGVLANLYLLPLDKLLKQHRVKHLRYSDDLMVFGQTWKELRGLLVRINHICRSRHLSLSGPKTKIVAAENVLVEFEDSQKDAIKYGIEIEAEGSIESLREFFDQAADAANLRDVRFSLTQLALSGDDWAVPWLVVALPAFPHLGPVS